MKRDEQAGAASPVERTRQSILGAYRRKSPQSAVLYARGSRSLAGGTTGNLRHFHPYPLYFSSGAGSKMLDVDGNRYIDCFLCNGPLLLGHLHPAIVAATRQQFEMGSLLVNPLLAMEAAEEIQRSMPSAERVRFLNSGTEAVLTAVRLARAFTGKSKIVKFHGHYHGQDDQFLVGLGPTSAVFGAGIPAGAHANTLLVPYGDLAAVEALLDRESDVAAILLDAAMHSGGLWGSDAGYLKSLRALTAQRGVLLIFDEVITGFRLASGGAQALYGVTPDLSTLGKALAAGEKLAAVIGREDILRALDPERATAAPTVFQSGTGNDGTAALAAAGAAVRTYRTLESQGEYRRLNLRAERLAIGLRAAFGKRNVPCHVNQLGPMLQLFFTDAPPSFAAYAAVPTWPLALFYMALINEDVLLSLPTSNHIYLSFAHTDADIDRILDSTAVALGKHDFAELIHDAA